jgi:hypothetical protein
VLQAGARGRAVAASTSAVARLVDDDARVRADHLLPIAGHARVARARLRLLLEHGLAVLPVGQTSSFTDLSLGTLQQVLPT